MFEHEAHVVEIALYLVLCGESCARYSIARPHSQIQENIDPVVDIGRDGSILERVDRVRPRFCFDPLPIQVTPPSVKRRADPFRAQGENVVIDAIRDAIRQVAKITSNSIVL